MMNQVISLASWNFRIARRWYAGLCAVFATQQFVVLMAMAGRVRYLRCGYAGLYWYGYQLFALGAAFLAAGILSARNLMQNRGRTHAAYLWLTLPQPRWIKLLAQVLTALVMELGILALQVVLYVAYYFPVEAMQRWRAARYLTQAMPADSLYEQLLNSELMMIYPTTLLRLAFLLLLLAASSVLLPCIFIHTGWRRIVAAGMALAAGICCLALLAQYDSYSYILQTEYATFAIKIILAMVLTLLGWLWALRSIRRAEPAL